MSSDLEWTIEYDEAPDERPEEFDAPGAPEEPERPGGGWRWVWRLAPVALAAGLLIALWVLGGEPEALPAPDPPQHRLEAAVQAELNALNTGDEALLAQLQGGMLGQERLQPPPQAWFAALDGSAGEIALVKSQILGPELGRAEIQVAWEGRSYRLCWTYRLENELWRRTSYCVPEGGGESEAVAPLFSEHLEMLAFPDDRVEAGRLLLRLESLIEEGCRLLPCQEPDSPTRILPYTYLSGYGVEELPGSPGSYLLPSPRSVRWPRDGEPEPLLLGSIGRRLLCDRVARPVLGDLTPEGQVALTLFCSAMAHDLLGLEPLPTTLWLGEAAASDGWLATLGFLNRLSAGERPQAALEASFAPGTVARVTQQPDYFGWVALLSTFGSMHWLGTSPGGVDMDLPGGPDQTVELRLVSPDGRELGVSGRIQLQGDRLVTSAGGVEVDLLEKMDRLVEPWSASPYGMVLPVVERVRFQRDWAIAFVQSFGGWPTTFFFRWEEGGWRPERPDESLMGEERVADSGWVRIHYHAWEEAYIPALQALLEPAGERLAVEVGLVEGLWHWSVRLAPSATELSTMQDNEIILFSPMLRSWAGESLDEAYQAEMAADFTRWATAVLWSRRKPKLGFIYEGMRVWLEGRVAEELGLPTYSVVPYPSQIPPLGTIRWVESGGDLTAEELLGRGVLLVEYLAEEYGGPSVTAGLHQAESVTALVTRVSGRSLEAFEADWRAWIEENRPSE